MATTRAPKTDKTTNTPPIPEPTRSETVVEERVEVTERHQPVDQSTGLMFPNSEERPWTHTPLLVIAGAIAGLIITMLLYFIWIKPFLVDTLSTYPFGLRILVFWGLWCLTLWPIGKFVQRIRMKSTPPYYASSVTVTEPVDS